MKVSNLLLNLMFLLITVAVAYSGWRFVVQPHSAPNEGTAATEIATHREGSTDESVPFRLSPEARKNLGLEVRAIQPTSYDITVEIPGIVKDRPGVSDRGVVAPVTGIVTRIFAFPGEHVTPNSPLFTLRLVSESLHTSQLELFKATKEIEISRKEKERLENLARSGAVATARIIEIENQIARMGVQVQAFRQDLLARGMSAESIDAASQGDFLTEITIRSPAAQISNASSVGPLTKTTTTEPGTELSFEMQALKVELGQQVDSGQLLCSLGDHRALLIEGQGFRKEMSLVQKAAKEQFPVDVVFEGQEAIDWPAYPHKFIIEHLANIIDPETRTFSFFLPLTNQWQVHQQEGKPCLIWRYRPGERVRVRLCIEKLADVFVLPLGGVAREGPEAFVFQQNGDLFVRLPVHILYEDTTTVVIAREGPIRKGLYLAQNGAASLNRVFKAKRASGQPADFHVHADGTVHAAH